MFSDPILLIIILLAGLYMAWNIGANDVANAMGTSVGSKALTLSKAVLIAGVLEFCGAFFLGSHVSKTMQSGIIDPSLFASQPHTLLYGMLSALIATALWLQVASYFGWPVSTTHAIVGALLGFGAFAGGLQAVKWSEVGTISLSWIVSPGLSGLFAYLIFSALQKKVLFALDPVKAARKLIPGMTFIVLFVFTLTILHNGIGSFHANFSSRAVLLFGIGFGLLGGLGGFLFVRQKAKKLTFLSRRNNSVEMLSLSKATRHLKRAIVHHESSQKDELITLLKSLEKIKTTTQKNLPAQGDNSQYQLVERLFVFLQILSASYVAFAHGANDVANAIGPVAACIQIIKGQSLAFSGKMPAWLLALGGIGIVLGLATWGWRVMETIGKKITELTPTRGFSAEFGAAITILVASKLGLPISTTHCIVGAVLGVGLAKGLSAVNIKTLKEIVLSWIITIPSSAIVSILIFYFIRMLLGGDL